MTTLTTQNETLNKIANVLAKAKDDRASIINDVIAIVIAESKDFKSQFKTKRLAQKWIVENMLENAKSNEVNNYIKRALYVAKAVLVEGYIIRKEWLTIAQAEKLVRCDKNAVNKAMSYDDEEVYTDETKDIIKNREIDMAIATLKKADAIPVFNALKTQFGDDTRKVLNAMLKAL